MLKPDTSNIFLYGKGIFTTVAIHKHRPFLWEKHWRRITKNAESVGIDLSDYDENLVREQLDKAITANKIREGRARLTFSDARPSRLWRSENESLVKTRLSVLIAERKPIPLDFKLTVSPYQINSQSPLAGIKSCNYLAKILALDEAKGRGFDEAIQLNERGEVTSASMANVFWLRDNVLFTPSLATGCLAGTTREFVLENVECGEVEAGIDECESADAIFLTSAGLGVVEVAELDARKFKSSGHSILDL